LKTEDDILLESFLNRTFFQGFQNPEKYINYNRIELYLFPNCNMTCKYCYLNKYGDKLYPKEIVNFRKIKENSYKLVDWLKDIGFRGGIEIFSGEPLIHDFIFDILYYIIDNLDFQTLVIPSNMSFLLYEKYKKKTAKLLDYAESLDKYVRISASFDGKHSQKNRPFKHNIKVNVDKWSDEIFRFSSKYKIGFHPMIYSNEIEKWKENFLWFQEMFRKYNMSFSNIYLLEVRNMEWTTEQILYFQEFIDFLIKWTHQKLGRDNFIDFILHRKGYNLLASPFITVGRGIGCSIQSTLTVRLGDLAIVPCHRTSYSPFIAGYLEGIDENGFHVKAKNPALFLSIMSFDKDTLPYCSTCPIKSLCSAGCLGAQYEVNGDMFTPIPTVCALEYAKISQIIKSMKEIGVLDEIKYRIRPTKLEAIKYLEEKI